MPPHTHIQIIEHPANPAIRSGRTPQGHIVVRPVLVCGVNLNGKIINELINVEMANQLIKEIWLVRILISQPIERVFDCFRVTVNGRKEAIDHIDSIGWELRFC